MNLFLVLTFLFAVGSAAGWAIELVFRRIVHKKWMNPGFLHGPYLPLYGFGLILMFFIARIPLDAVRPSFLQYALRLVIICFVMTAIEYVAGIIFIKGMNIRLWDYSDRKGNIQGIICPLFSLIWTAAGALYVFFIDDAISRAVSWFTSNLYYSFFVGVFFGLFIWDLSSTMMLSTKIRSFAKSNRIVVRYEELKLTVRGHLEERKKKISFLNPFKSSAEELRKAFERYLNEIKTGIDSGMTGRRKKKRKAEKVTEEKSEKNAGDSRKIDSNTPRT